MDDGVLRVAFSPDDKHFVATTYHLYIHLWETHSGKRLHKLREPGTSGYFGSQRIHAVFAGDGKHIVSAGPTVALLWDIASGKLVRKFDHGDSVASCVAASSDGKHLLVGGWKKSVLLDTELGKVVQTFDKNSNRLLAVALSHDGKLAVTAADQDNSAHLWHVRSGNKLESFRGKRTILSVAIDRDGKHVLTGSSDKTAILWDAETGKAIHTFQGHADRVQDVALSPDGKQAVTASEDRSPEACRDPAD
jgi:WD40 repeat protein